MADSGADRVPLRADVPAGALPGLTDTHCHLDMPQFADDVPQTLERARSAGLVRMLLPGIDLASSRRAARLAHEHPLLRFAAGVHAHAAGTLDGEALAELRRLATAEGAAAIGEIGLDYFRDPAPRPRQQEAFRAQVELARELGLPVIVHIREAADDALEILAQAGNGLRGVLHAFSGDERIARRALTMGFFLGAAGPVTYPGAGALRGIFRAAPVDRILLETDSPYLPPQGFRGRRNEPALVRQTALRLAEERGTDPAALAAQTRANAAALFGWE
jgi:TatD DNase family protein